MQFYDGWQKCYKKVLTNRDNHAIFRLVVEKTYYSVKEVAGLLKVSKRTISRWIAKGILKALQVEGIVRIEKGDLESFVESHNNAPNQAGGG